MAEPTLVRRTAVAKPQAAGPVAPRPLKMALLQDIEERTVKFLWKPYIPMGTVTMIFGHGGVGKSWLAAEIAADVSSGRPLPGDGDVAREPIKVLMIASEDDAGEVLKPRLRLLDADMQRIGVASEPFRLDTVGIGKLEELLKTFQAAVVFIDPLVAYMGKENDISQANVVRDILSPLVTIARRTGAAIILVHHSRKGKGGDQQEAMGSADFINGPRSALHVMRSTGGNRIMRHVKSNWAKNGPSLLFAVGEDEAGLPKFEWGEFVEDELRPKFKEPVAKQKAADYIFEALRDGPKGAQELLAGAKKLGINDRTLDRAKKGLAASVKEDGMWKWFLLDRGSIDAALRPRKSEEDKVAAALVEARARVSKLKRKSEEAAS